MVRRRVALASAALASSLLVLAACSNPIDFKAEVEDAVKAGKDMYLKVSSVSPASNSTTVKPSDHLVIQFDRALDTATIAAAAITISPTAGGSPIDWTWSFNAPTNELTVTPAALESLTPYTVTVNADSGLAGLDASVIRDAYSWSFTTLNLPGGSLLIDGGATYTTDDLYQVDLSLSWNLKADRVRYSRTAFAATDPSAGDYVWQVPTNPVNNFQLASSEGSQVIYYQFGDSDDGTYSDVLQAGIVVDTVHPAAPTGLSVSAALDAVPTWTWAAGGGGNGGFEYSFDSGAAGATTATSYTRTIASSFPFNSSHTLSVRERDDAGNWSEWTGPLSFGPTSIYPLSGSTRLSTSLTFRWPAALYYRRLYLGTSPRSLIVVAEGLEADYCAYSKLTTGTKYYWKYEVYVSSTKVLYTSDVFSFMTNLFKI